MKREVYYREYVIPASEMRAASPTDDPYYDLAPDETWEADLLKYPTGGGFEWVRVVSKPEPFVPGVIELTGRPQVQFKVHRLSEREPHTVYRTAWEPVTVLRPVSTPPF